VRRIVITLLLAGIGALALPGVAGAGLGALDVELVSPVEPLTFSVDIVNIGCQAGTFDVTTVTANGTPVEPISVTEDPTDPTLATMVLPSDTPPGILLVVASCVSGGVPFTVTDTEEWAALAITKSVVGTPPPGATFRVNADCVFDEVPVTPVPVEFGDPGAAELPDDFSADFAYDASGGLAYLYTDHGIDCALTEPENGGASSVVIDPEVADIDEPGAFEATVTNTFVEPIVVAPTFTG
jgi:hypothetical protein